MRFSIFILIAASIVLFDLGYARAAVMRGHGVGVRGGFGHYGARGVVANPCLAWNGVAWVNTCIYRRGFRR